jgi:hypothetical protein
MRWLTICALLAVAVQATPAFNATVARHIIANAVSYEQSSLALTKKQVARGKSLSNVRTARSFKPMLKTKWIDCRQRVRPQLETRQTGPTHSKGHGSAAQARRPHHSAIASAGKGSLSAVSRFALPIPWSSAPTAIYIVEPRLSLVCWQLPPRLPMLRSTRRGRAKPTARQSPT